MKSKPKKTTKPKPKARKRTSSRVSSAAGRLMEILESGGFVWWVYGLGGTPETEKNITALVKMVAASAMGQRESKR